mmetsp:Transcript_7264/g.23667  ORF Transcript_7264/g.23667 Transcript_7264/m.23667 type:complete len:232 (+) Transcript_7264:488-1183(+)
MRRQPFQTRPASLGAASMDDMVSDGTLESQRTCTRASCRFASRTISNKASSPGAITETSPACAAMCATTVVTRVAKSAARPADSSGAGCFLDACLAVRRPSCAAAARSMSLRAQKAHMLISRRARAAALWVSTLNTRLAALCTASSASCFSRACSTKRRPPAARTASHSREPPPATAARAFRHTAQMLSSSTSSFKTSSKTSTPPSSSMQASALERVRGQRARRRTLKQAL